MPSTWESSALIEAGIVIGGCGEEGGDLLGTWYCPGWRIWIVRAEDALLSVRLSWRFELLAAPTSFRVFFVPDYALEGRLVGRYQIDWENGVTWYRDSPLYQAEARIYSQNGEDGVLLAILGALEIRDPVCLEFGVQDGRECNTQILAERAHAVLQWDCDHHDPARRLYREFVTLANIPELVERYEVAKDLDVLSIDVDLRLLLLVANRRTTLTASGLSLNTTARTAPRRISLCSTRVRKRGGTGRVISEPVCSPSLAWAKSSGTMSPPVLRFVLTRRVSPRLCRGDWSRRLHLLGPE